MEEHDSSFDVCIFCAMYEEAEAVLNEFSARCSVSFKSAFSRRDRFEYRHTTIQNAQKNPSRCSSLGLLIMVRYKRVWILNHFWMSFVHASLP